MLILQFLQYEQERFRKNKKNKPYKAAKGGHGKGKGKMGYALNNAPFSPKPKTPPLPKKDNPGLRGSKKLKPGALSLYVGDGHHLAVEAIRTYHLELPSGLVIVLNNCHYAPSITRGVILVSCLFDDGFINRFDDYNVISVSKNNLVYFMVIPRNGIFEIDMSYSNINDSSMYEITNKRAKINLDSSLLWHYRLGHISKKRIEKLLHDGLLNSFDIESLGKCVSCMSGKMARKPHSHQVERAKDLLRLIHTDVYLLKHKHEVFETFKVFQKEVENQLGKTIKSLHSNHRGEYMSQKFLDHLKEHGIISHRTPPYTPQNNRVSERRNRTLLDMVRSMMSQTTLPKSFWDYALETAARILNMNVEFFESNLLVLKASGSVEDLKLIQEEDTNPSVDTSLNHEEDDQEIDKPQSDINPIRKSSRIRHAPDRICLYIDAKEHKLGDLGEPANYKAALMDPESKKWLDAMNVEMQSVKDNDVRVLVELPPNARTVDAENIAAFDASKETVWICKFISGLSIVPTIEEPISMYCDNTKAIAIAKDGVTKGTSHFYIKVHYLHENIKSSDVKIKKIDTDDNLADPFTKALEFPKHSELTKNIGLLPTSSFILSVSMNNMFYFNAITVNGIYEIDMSDSTLPIVNSMYSISNKRPKSNLDSTYFWHCRLAHINKKVIEKLQHDGLLKSTDNEPFDQCVSCISGKMTRKPFSHKTEKVKDVLGLIHIDVCGPLRHVSKKESATRILNMVPTKKVDKTPYELWHGKDPNLSYLKWLVAVNAKMQSMYDNKVWRLVVLPPNAKVVKSKWIYKKKTDMDGKVHIYRARLVAKGCTQTYGVDYEETFSPVADIRAIRFLIAIASYYDYEIWQMDIKTTFLNGFLEEEIYMEQPKGFIDPIHLRKVEMKRMQNVPYASAIGSIMYVVRCTRPDVAFTQNITSRFQRNSSEAHWTAVKNILKYLRNTKDTFLVYGGAVVWKSSKESTTAQHTTEAEYIAAFEAAKEAVWIRKFIDELCVVPLNDYLIKINCDNSTTIIMAKESKFRKGSRSLSAEVLCLISVMDILVDSGGKQYSKCGALYACTHSLRGAEAASYVKEHAMRLFFESSDLPEATTTLDGPEECSISDYCGTVALTVLVLERHLLISNARDCRVVISRKGVAKQMSNDHKPSNLLEKKKVKELGGYFEEGYLNEMTQMVLTKDDEFMIIGCDGIWDVMSNEEAVCLVQKQLMQHNDLHQYATELINQALCLHTSDNLTAIVVCFSSHIEPPNPW
uniref:Retrotransposon protein, putative, Ty1-copia subclass n=1 Tax=Tanacetum cinerariifolium TaxID=118510 RepID=A0A6L2L6D7_TANCI|nr:retrotransposon protein, putative, Ty1-copia subclass [Tanacetum cinerariifolium]